MKNIKTLLASALLTLSACHTAYAQTTAEYVANVGKALNKTWAMPGYIIGNIRTDVLITPQGAVVYKSSGNKAYDAEVIRAANSVLDATVETNIAFPVEFRNDTNIRGFEYVEGVGYYAK